MITVKNKLPGILTYFLTTKKLQSFVFTCALGINIFLFRFSLQQQGKRRHKMGITSSQQYTSVVIENNNVLGNRARDDLLSERPQGAGIPRGESSGG